MQGAMLGGCRLEREIGSGAMGRVFLSRRDGDPVAVKVLHPHLLGSPGFFKRFLREAEIGRSVDHPNVVRTIDADAAVWNGATCHFLVMEYVEGQTLRELLDELRTLPEELCRHVGREVAKGLAAVHAAGAVHRDLKPANVIFTPSNAVKIMDLGLARLVDEAIRLSQPGIFVGTVAYCAPEQLTSGSAEIDHRTDLFALGALLYELSTGNPPFGSDELHAVIRRVVAEAPPRPRDVRPDLSPFFEEMVLTLLAKDPAERFPDAGGLADVLADGEHSAWWRERRRSVYLRRPAGVIPRLRVRRETALHGRQDEMQLLLDRSREVAGGAGRVVLIEGEAGIGKSRLADELALALEAEGAHFHFVSGSYPPGGGATVAGAFMQALRQHLGDDAEAEVHRLLPDRPALAAGLLEFLSGGSPHGARLDREFVQTLVIELVRALARERPLVLHVDDLHFAPPDGLALFAALATALVGERVLLLGAWRPGLPAAWAASLDRLEHVTRIELRRLGPKDLVKLLADAFGSARLAEDLAARVALKSDGNPFFAFEIVRGLKESGRIVQQPDGSFAAAGTVRDLDIPSSIHDLVLARVADLSDEERDLLDVAACAGFDFDPRLVGEASGLATVPALRLFGRIERSHRLIRASGVLYVFDHHQVHEALYRGIGEGLRREYHLALAAAMERREAEAGRTGDAIPAAVAAEIAEQHLRGGRIRDADPYLDRALDYLRDGGRLGRARTLFEEAAEMLSDLPPARAVDLLTRAAEILERAGEPAEAAELQHRALGLAVECGPPARVAKIRARHGRLLLALGRIDEAEAELVRADGDARAAGDEAVQMEASLELGNLLHHVGRPEARKCYERALDLAERLGRAPHRAKAEGNLAILDYEAGRVDAARAHLEAAIETFRRAGDRLDEARAIGLLGLIEDRAGRFDEGTALHERQLELATQIGWRRGVAVATLNLADSHLAHGRLVEAQQRFQEAERLSREIGDAIGRLDAGLDLAIVHQRLGEFERGRRALLTTLREARRLRSTRHHGLAWLHLGVAHLYAGRPRRAAAALRRARRVFEKVGDGTRIVSSLLHLGAAAAETGDAEASERHLREAIEVARQVASPPLLAFALCHLARLDEFREEAQREFDRWNAAWNIAERLEASVQLWLATGRRAYQRMGWKCIDLYLAAVPEDRRSGVLEAHSRAVELLVLTTDEESPSR